MNFIVYTKPHCHSCEEIKSQLDSKGYGYLSVNMLELPGEEISDLRKWAASVGQRSMPIVRAPGGELISNQDLINLLEGK